MIKIEHVAIWVKDLENMKDFYVKYFNVRSGEKYSNPAKKYSSYFIFFEGSSRLELMHHKHIREKNNDEFECLGWAHM
ncbi:MAG: VOC family protein, partial [Cyclobacteriaceae bacterium]|nr:VOC family protein [Cyclobacteriaceae bacterium]